jgi:acetolactate synthase-1/2/3 large subunit
MRAHQYLAQALEDRGVSAVFEVVGGMITFLLDSLHTRTKVRVVSMHHEQGAAFAADAFGRITGIPGVALATSGPGATNLLTGIGSCYFDSSPAVFITGQVNTHELKGARAIRQSGFQETDIVSVARPLTKAAWMAERADEIPTLLDRAFALAVADRPGPVLIDIPLNLQAAEIEAPPARPAPEPVLRAESGPLLDELLAALARAERPLLLVGGGVQAARAAAPLRLLAERLQVPVLSSLLGVDVLPAADPLRVGMIGTYGNRWANLALGRSDLLVVLGSRLDIRQTGADTEFFARGRTIFHVDCERDELNRRVPGCRAIHEHLRPLLAEAAERAARLPRPERAAWLAELAELRRAWPDTAELTGLEGINPNALMHRLSAAAREVGAYAVDVGQHQMWAAQSLDLAPGQRFLTSGGMGSMGFALPAAIGASVALGDRPVVVVAGDGGFQCNIQELQTVARSRLPLKIAILDNGCHGMVRQFQESYFDGRYHSTVWGYSAPDFRKVAEAYGIAAAAVASEAELDAGIAALFADPAAPALLHVKIPMAANAYPKIAFGHPLTEMEPHFKPLDIEGT